MPLGLYGSKDRVAFIFNVSMFMRNAVESLVVTMCKEWPAFASLDGQTLTYVFAPLNLMAFFVHLKTLQMKATRSSETSGATYPATRRHIPGDQTSPVVRFGNLKAHKNLRSFPR